MLPPFKIFLNVVYLNCFSDMFDLRNVGYRGIIPLFKLLIKQNFMDIQNALDIINTEQLKGTAVYSLHLT